MSNKEIYRKALGLIDLTSLHPQDTPSSIRSMVEKVNAFSSAYPAYPLPASICVFPNFAGVVKSALNAAGVGITVVGGCFPASQSPIDVKVLECVTAVREGADEVDIVLALNAFLDGDRDGASREIAEIGEAIRAENPSVRLKVILETGALTPEQIREASFLAMEAGADFIKTSTGKMQPAATPEAARIMCSCIREYYEKTGRMVGFKPAGGISSADDVLTYYDIVDGVLGDKWLDSKWFRIGASSLANNLLSALEGSPVKYF